MSSAAYSQGYLHTPRAPGDFGTHTHTHDPAMFSAVLQECTPQHQVLHKDTLEYTHQVLTYTHTQECTHQVLTYTHTQECTHQVLHKDIHDGEGGDH